MAKLEYEPTDFIMSIRGKFHRPIKENSHCEIRKILDKRPVGVESAIKNIRDYYGRPFVVCKWCIGEVKSKEEALDLLEEIRDGYT